MKRVRAEALVLVNWKGVFYERYLFDKHVTALEGANGSGKTTVMIAAYVVLLPDMTRLRFTNLGESSATGGDKGIFGRLGNPDGPSYAAIDFRLGNGERLLAGVHLQRRSEPTVELTPFVIKRTSNDVALQDILLDRKDVDTVPDMNRFRELATLRAGRIKVFSKTADYFAELFELGVSPLRLTADDERTKFNEMLRTSMVGGISRALTGGLRDFLLKAETGLADTLKRMRGNLDACQRTRLEVREAQRMEEEIHGVFEAGQAMFAAAIHATRKRADETRSLLETAEKALAAALKHESELDKLLTQKREEHEKANQGLQRLKENVEAARQQLEQVRKANEIASRITKLEVVQSDQTRQVKQRQEEHEQSKAVLKHAKELLRKTQEGVEKAVGGIADFQQGLDELHRRAAAFVQVSRRLELARSGLPEEDVQPDSIEPLRVQCEEMLKDFDTAIVRRERQISTAREKRREFDRVIEALSALTGKKARNALQAARGILGEIRQLQSLADELPELPERLENAQALASRQRRIRQEAKRLGTKDNPLNTSPALQQAFSSADEESLRTARDLFDVQSELSDAVARLKEAKTSRENLEQLLPKWKEVRDLAKTLEEERERPLRSPADLEALHLHIMDNRDTLKDLERNLTERLETLTKDMEQLDYSGGRFEEDLLAARDAVDGEFLAGHFDDVSEEDSGRIEARLGPLLGGIVVEDTATAAQTLANLPRRPDHIWLVDPKSILPDEEDTGNERFGDNVFVPGSHASRLSKIPDQPMLGRRARELRIQELHSAIDLTNKELLKIGEEQRRSVDALEKIKTLFARSDLLDRPEPDLKNAADDVEAAMASKMTLGEKVQRLQDRLARHNGRRKALQALLADAFLLDPPDHDSACLLLERRFADAKKAKQRIEDTAADVEILQDGLDVLRAPPPSKAEMELLSDKLEASRQGRDNLSRPLDALCYIEENRYALGWPEAPRALREKQALRPALEEQLRHAKSDHEQAQEEADAAGQSREASTAKLQKASGELDQTGTILTREKQGLKDTGIDDPGDDALAAAKKTNWNLNNRLPELEVTERRLNNEVVETNVLQKRQHNEVEKLTNVRDEKMLNWRPDAQRWEHLETEAEKADLLKGTMTDAIIERTRSASSLNLYQDAISQGELLAERLGQARAGLECAKTVRQSIKKKEAGQTVGVSYLHAWLEAREWLRRRVPPQIAEMDDPLETLAQVRDHLGRLLDRLAGQERNLRGHSGDVARNIDTHRRKARREVNRLNQDLRRVHFGSIQGVSIKVRPVESRDKVLRALRDGDAQQLLFQSDMPLEEAMEELFKKYGGGKTGGHRLLDYREYLNLQVEVQRQPTQQWEHANPTRMSTGEAIGVGAAIMMVVLTAWERNANLLRSKQSEGTLRLLFLDEANRLSQDNLGVLFDLCQNLELQLLIAAPEVSQAEGNTTYHLVRQLDDSEQEIVRVTGRRTLHGRHDVE